MHVITGWRERKARSSIGSGGNTVPETPNARKRGRDYGAEGANSPLEHRTRETRFRKPPAPV